MTTFLSILAVVCFCATSHAAGQCIGHLAGLALDRLFRGRA